MSFAFQKSEGALERAVNILLADKKLDQIRTELDAANNDAWTEVIFTTVGSLLGFGKSSS